MSNLVVAGAMLECSFSEIPAVLVVLPENRVMAEGRPAANIEDSKPIINIPTFGLCNSLTNPEVASATTAAAGVLTPMPCIPMVEAPWLPGSPAVLIGGLPALNNESKCLCNWLGVISIVEAGTIRTCVP